MNGKHYYVTVDGDYICVEDNNTDFNLATWNNGVIEVEDFDYPSSAYQSGSTSIDGGGANDGVGTTSLTLGGISFSIGTECASHGDGSGYDSSGAKELSGDCYYYATWSSDSDDTYKYIYWTIYFYNDSLSNRTWKPQEVSYTVTERPSGETPHYKAWYQNGPGGSSTTAYGDTAEDAAEALYATTKRAYGGAYSGFRNFQNTYQHSSSAPGGAGHINFDACSQNQIFYAKVGAKAKNSVYLNVKKSTDSAYSNIVNNNSNYSLKDTKFDVYWKDGNTYKLAKDKNGDYTITIDADGNSNTLEYDASWIGYTVYLKETQAGKGYRLNSDYSDGVTLAEAGETYTAKISNKPVYDPANIQLSKISNNNQYNGTISPANAIYRVEQFDAITTNPSGSAVKTWYYATDSDGVITTRKPSYIANSNNNWSTASSSTYVSPTSSAGYLTWPIGTYRIKEVRVPMHTENGSWVESGLKLSSHTYIVTVEQASSGSKSVTTTIYRDGTQISSVTRPSDDTTATPQAVEDEETESWYPIGVVKVDKTKADGGVTGVGTTPNKNVPQGDATFNGAQYYLYTTKNITDKFFSKSQNRQLYTLTNVGNNLWQVYNANGTPVVITTGPNGFGQTLSTLPYADCYAVREFKEPAGYKLDSTLYTVTSKWTTNDGATIIDTFVVGPQTYNVPTVTGYRGAKGDVTDDVTRFNLAVKKKDVIVNEDGTTTVLTQGDASLAGIRYAVVNRSANPVVFNGKDFAPNRIVTVITTNANGDANVRNIPYGSYEVYELRADAQSDANVIGQQVNVGVTDLSGGVFGTSKYANFINGKPSGYLHSEDSIDVPTTSMKYTVIGKKITGHPTSTTDNAETYTVDTYYNEPVKNTITVVKKDIELNTEDTNQGVNKLSGIKFAVINNSKKDSSNPLNGGVWYKGTFYEVGDVVEVLTTDEHGSATTDELPFGTYIIRELRKDNLVEPGDVWANLTSDKLGTSIYANDYYIYTDTKNDTINETYTTHDSTQKVVSLSPAISTEVSEAIVKDVNADAPVRGDIDFLKVNIDGDVMSYIPFMVQHLDENRNVLETHVVITDAQGHINTETRKNKSYSTINTLDSRLQYKDDGTPYFDETGINYEDAANVNIWFGDVENYEDKDFICDNRGSFLYGTYKITELQSSKNEGMDMLGKEFTITKDNDTVTPDGVMVDLEVVFTSEALDVRTDSTNLTIGSQVTIDDTVDIEHLKSYIETADGEKEYLKYKIETEIVNVKKDGTKVSLGTFEPKHITYDNHGRVVESEDNTFMPEVYDNPDNDLDPTRTTYVHDFVLRSTGIDTSNVEPGSYVAVIDHVYQWDSTNNVWTHIVTHNEDCTEESQKLYAPDINTLATNNSTKTRVASLDPKTKASDIISYEGLGEGNDYVFTIKLVDDNNNIIKDVNDNDCVITTTLHTQAKDSNGNLLNSVYYVPSGNYLLGPGTASFKFDEVGFEPFEIPNDVINMHFVVSASNSVFDSTVGDIVSDAILSHNADLTDELEVIRRPQFTTLASSVDGYTNQMLPCDKEVSIKDTLSYTNLAETIEVKVVSKATVVKINDDTVDKSLLNKVVLTSENYATLEQAVGTTKSTEVILDSFDTTPYAGTTLSVSSKIYMVVDGQDVLIGNHNEDNTDESEWVAIPKIGTTAYNTSDGRNYKVISREYADVTLTDYVNFTTIEGNKAWTFTATLMDKVTEEPVKDANGNIVTKDVTFTPLTDENVIISKRETINGVEMVSGTYPVPITFTQVLKSYDWEEAEEPWVIFEDVKPHTPGHTEVKYAVHNDLEDDKQTVTHPLFRTTVANTKTGLKNVAATDNQSVTDTVEFKYFKQAVKEGDKFTLVIEAHNAADGSPILDKDGKVYTNSKVFTYKGQKSEDIELTFDATGFEGQTIVFYETLYYGENKFEDKYKVLVEDDNTLAEQSVTIPEIHTTAVDVVSNSHTLTFDKKIKDVVDMKGIAPNTEYKLITKIFDKDTNSIVTDSNGKDVVWEKDYKSGDANTEGTIHHEEVSHIEYKTSDGEQFVTEREAIAHIEDADLTDDTIEEVKVVDVEEGDETVIIPAVSDTVTVNMDLSKLDANTFKSIEGHDIVIYEYLYMVKYPDTPYAAHTDKNDKDQTIEIPEVHTELLDGGNLTHEVALAGEEITLVDTVYYSNLLVGESYEIKGVLMDKDKKEPLKDANGKTVEGTAKLENITNPNGQAKITFTVNADVLTNLMITKDAKGNSVYTATPKDIVAFETLTTYAIEGETTKIYTYSKEEDLSDKDQTVTVPNPTTHTTIKDAADNDNVIDGTKKNQTIIDTVYYDNLIVGKEYTVTGKLVVKSRNGELIKYETDEKGEIINPEYVKDANGKIVTASTTFKPTKSTGTVDVVFENIDTTLYAGTKIVGFESVKYGDIEVMSHNDINDESQTLTISLQLHAQIAKADNDNVKYYLKGAEITIWKMQYTDKDGNPVPISQVTEDNSGQYAVTQKVATDINGNECKGLTDENGMVNYTVLFDETAKYYAQETKAPDGYLINSNMFEITPTGEKESDGVDLIKISVLDKRITRRPKTGDTTPIMLLIAFICMGTLGGAGLLLTSKKKNGAKVTNVNTNVTNADDAEITEKQDE